ncbi:MAG: cupin domain-containing protein [Victivallaceae bacterium]|nr:cupin domain-containing protein [Victivallaceae bacterium]
MIRHSDQYRLDLREEMRGGNGTVKIEHLWEPGKEMLSATRMCSRITLAPGNSIGFHRHDQEEEIFFILSGTAEADDDGKKGILRAGDTLLTGNGAGHAIRNAGSDDLVLLAFIGKYPEK